jgi:hypothetical protein
MAEGAAVKRRLALAALLAGSLLAGASYLWYGRAGAGADALHRHGIAGPAEATTLPVAPARTPPSTYSSGGESALAILVNDPAASWLGLVHALKARGVPVRVLSDPDVALRHDVVIVYPSLTGSNTSAALQARLANHVHRGGTLIAFAVVGGGLRDLFGFREAEEVTGLRELRLVGEATAGWRPDAAEAHVPLIDNTATAGLPGVRYHGLARAPVATYDDGSAAIVGGAVVGGAGAGWAYAVGVDLGHFVLRAHNGRFDVPAAAYVNTHAPKVDGLARMIEAWYVQGEPDAVTLATAPHGRAFAALVTHDIDYTGSMNNVEAFAAEEQARGIAATYFVQTKYVTDYHDRSFFGHSRRTQLQALVARGMEVASHTVSHSDAFKTMPLGTGTERYPDYQPFVKTFDTARDATVLGELRVSKYLLETLSQAPVVSFRPGHLSLPPTLPQALAATGYRYSSSITAGQAMTHLPYRTMHDRTYDAETDVFEFPVTIEDERWSLADNVEPAIALARAVGHRGGMVNLLIHTDRTHGKLEFVRRFHAALAGEAWFGTLLAYGNWWAARDRVQVDVQEASDGVGRTLTVLTPLAIDGLTLEVPAGWQVAPGAPASQAGRRVVLPRLDGGARTSLRFTGGA